jgi:outer membrane protein assembly factor BamE (lipoprotein component of BamABCDE complex)
MKRVYLTIICLLTFSCMSIGNNFPSQTNWLKKDTSDKKDVVFVLGKPNSVGNSGGVETWTYSFYKYTFFKSTNYKELKIYWNKKGKLKHYQFTSSFPQDLKSQLATNLKHKKQN